MEKRPMEISVRSYLTAGMVAVVGAGAIAMAPALPGSAIQAVGLPAPAVAEIALTGTSLPLEQMWTLVQTFAKGGSLTDIVNGVFGAVGTEFVTQALPLLNAVVTDAATYLGAALTDVIRSGGLQVDFPGILAGVGTALGAGDFPGALKAVNDGLSAPITRTVQTVFGSAFQAFLTDKAGTVLGALPELLRSAVQKVLGLDIKPVIDAITKAVSGLFPGPGAAVPVALATADESPTIVCNMPAIRPTEPSTQLPAVAAGVGTVEPAKTAPPAAPASAAAAVSVDAHSDSVDVQADSRSAQAPAEDVSGVKDVSGVNEEAAEPVTPTEPEIPATPHRVAHRGAGTAGNAAHPATRVGARHQ